MIDTPTIDNYTIDCIFDADVLKQMLNDDTIAKDDKKKLKQLHQSKQSATKTHSATPRQPTA